MTLEEIRVVAYGLSQALLGMALLALCLLWFAILPTVGIMYVAGWLP